MPLLTMFIIFSLNEKDIPRKPWQNSMMQARCPMDLKKHIGFSTNS
jgi:hypothetical protein